MYFCGNTSRYVLPSGVKTDMHCAAVCGSKYIALRCVAANIEMYCPRVSSRVHLWSSAAVHIDMYGPRVSTGEFLRRPFTFLFTCKGLFSYNVRIQYTSLLTANIDMYCPWVSAGVSAQTKKKKCMHYMKRDLYM